MKIKKSKAHKLSAHLAIKQGIWKIISEHKGQLTIGPKLRLKPNLRELVERITPENRHGEVDWGPPVGRELW